jgi:hypothetical protein
MTEFINFAVCVITIACWFSAAIFVVGYGVAAPWYRSEAGRQLFFSGVVFFEICSLVAYTEIWGTDWYGRPYIRLFVWGQVLLFLLWRNRIFFTAQFRKDYPHGQQDRDGKESVQR